MAKRLSEQQKKEIIKFFINGKTIDQLSNEFKCTKLTISRNLKKNLGENEYKDLINNRRFPENHSDTKKKNNKEVNYDSEREVIENNQDSLLPLTPFVEITPLSYEIENTLQKDLSSVPISDFNFPKIVYMIVDKKIELETKYLKDYPEWQFLSQEELKRKTIQIYFDLNIAKRFCNKDQKVIKVPNTNVFKIVAPLLISKGISRIVSEDKLIAL